MNKVVYIIVIQNTPHTHIHVRSAVTQHTKATGGKVTIDTILKTSDM